MKRKKNFKRGRRLLFMGVILSLFLFGAFAVFKPVRSESGIVWEFPLDVRASVSQIKTIRDVDGDQKNDVIAATSTPDTQTYLLSGSTGSRIWSTASGFVTGLTVLDDVNADGIQDVAVHTTIDRLKVLNGVNGETIWNYTEISDDSNALVGIQDINGDSVMDLIVGTNTYDHRIIAFSGTDGQILWQYDGGNGIKYQHLALLDDIDGDGKQDIVAGTGTSRFATLALSGTTGSVIWLREGFQGLNNIFGGPVAVIRGQSGSLQTIINFGDAGSVIDRQNWLRRLNSTNGNTVWENISPLGYEFQNITVIPDIDGDGMDDVVTPTSTATQKLLCISARLGKEIWMRPADVVRSPVIANLNGVGEAEIVVTEPNHFKTIALRSKDGSMLWQFVTGGSTYEDMPNGIAISEDLNGNGSPEVITSGRGKIYAVDGLGP